MNKMMKYLAKNKHTDLMKEKYNLIFKLKSKEAEISSLNSTIEEKESQISKFKELPRVNLGLCTEPPVLFANCKKQRFAA